MRGALLLSDLCAQLFPSVVTGATSKAILGWPLSMNYPGLHSFPALLYSCTAASINSARKCVLYVDTSCMDPALMLQPQLRWKNSK